MGAFPVQITASELALRVATVRHRGTIRSEQTWSAVPARLIVRLVQVPLIPTAQLAREIDYLITVVPVHRALFRTLLQISVRVIVFFLDLDNRCYNYL